MTDYIIGIAFGIIIGSLITGIAMKSHQLTKESAENKQKLQQYQDKKLWDNFFHEHNLYLDWDISLYGNHDKFHLIRGNRVLATWYEDGEFSSNYSNIHDENIDCHEYLDILMFIKMNAKTDNMCKEWKELGY